MLIAATADIHSPKNFEFFVRAVDSIQTMPDIFLLCGDIVDKGDVDEYSKINNTLFGKFNCPIIACFGNSEYGKETTDRIKERYKDIIFLEDESIVLEIKNKKVGIVGTKGSLDRPTLWQSRNLPAIEDEYRLRVQKVKDLLAGLECDVKILLIHYAPTYKILEGENPYSYPELGSSEFEKVLLEQTPHIVICGHAHKGKKQIWLNSVPVFNVGLMLNGKIVLVDTEKDLKHGIEKFI